MNIRITSSFADLTCTKYLTKCAIFAIAAVVTLAASAASHAAPVYGEPADLSGTRTVGAVGLDNISSDPSWDDVVLRWVITDNGNNTYHYSYTLENFNQPAISHFTLDVTDSAIVDETPSAGLVTNAQLNGFDISASLEFGNKDGITGAVKFDIREDGIPVPEGTDLTYSFNSNRAPVWGDFFIKGGRTT